MDPWCMLQRTWRRASWCRVSNRFAPALPLHVYIACTCIRATRSVCPPRMQSATMNSSRSIFHENAPSYPLLLRAPFSLSSASPLEPLIAPLFFSTPPFVFYSLLASRLSTLTKCLTVKRPTKSLANLLFFSPFFLTSLVIHASHCARFYYDDTSQQCDTAAKIELFYDSKVLCLTSTCRMWASFNAMSFFFLPNPSSLFQVHPLFKNYVFFCSFDIEVTRILRERRVHFFFANDFEKDDTRNRGRGGKNRRE